jgi:hypothetical protein
MELTAVDVSARGPHGPVLEPTGVRAISGAISVVTGYPGAGHVALALALAGRLPLSSGEVLIDGVADIRRLQRAVALVDAPGVTEPEPALRVGAVVGEELAIAGRRGWRNDVRTWLTRRGRRDLAEARFEKLDPELRLDLLVELAGSSAAVEVLVLVMPDRHGVPASLIWHVATDAAARGLAVIVTVAATTGEQLAAAPSVIGTRSVGEPVPIAPIAPLGDPADEQADVDEPGEPADEPADEPAVADDPAPPDEPGGPAEPAGADPKPESEAEDVS